MGREALTEQTLVNILLDPVSRDRLFAAMAEEEGSLLPLSNRFAELAGRCEATPEQLRIVIVACIEHGKDERFIQWLLFHPDIPNDLLLDLAQQEAYPIILAHRRGPRDLLEYLASRHRISEAITTLALNHYRFEDDSTFAAFIAEHATDSMLSWNLRRVPLTPEKRTIANALLKDKS